MLRTVRFFVINPLTALLLTALTCTTAVQAAETATLAIITADGSHHDLDTAKIAALPQHTLDTQTAWTKGVQHFDGVLLRDVLLAQKINGKALTRCDKGPFWIVYPPDQHSELNDSRYDHRWAWQLKQLQIK